MTVTPTTLASPTEAEALLRRLGATPRLLMHLRLVGEAAEDLIAQLERLRVPFDRHIVRIGVAVHDAGKILHPDELDGPGSRHEPAGERLLLDRGVDPKVARCCLSHARWRDMVCSFEELLIALADKLWKGARVEELEQRVIEAVAAKLGVGAWDVFVTLDTCFEEIAAGGFERLERS